jgi:hypothetical protein
MCLHAPRSHVDALQPPWPQHCALAFTQHSAAALSQPARPLIYKVAKGTPRTLTCSHVYRLPRSPPRPPRPPRDISG